MKIDLHIHTKKVCSGEPQTRNIEPQRLVEILNDCSLGIAAITNHDLFDLENFEKILEEAEKLKCETLIFPGIEIKVKYENKTRHMNVIVSNKIKTRKLFFDILEKSDVLKKNKPENLKFFKDIEEVFKTFDELDPIYCLDFKSSDSSFIVDNKDEQTVYKEIKEKTKNPVIVDCGNNRSAIVFNSHDIDALIGSDVKNWNRYEQDDFPRLMNINLEFSSFEELRFFLLNDQNAIKKVISRNDEEIINISIKTSEFTIKLYKGVNVIFGDKGSGKTEILKEIEKNFSLKEKKKVIYQVETINNDFKFKFNNKSTMSEDIKKDYIKLDKFLEQIKKHKDPKVDYLEDITEFFKKETSSKLIYKDNEEINKIKPQKIFEKIINFVEKIKNFYNDSVKMKNDLIFKNLEKEFQKNISSLQIIMKLLKKNYIRRITPYREAEFLNKTVKIVENIVRENQGKDTQSKQIGLFFYYQKRKELLNNFEGINSIYKNEQFSSKKVTNESRIPGKGVIKFVEYFAPVGYEKPVKVKEKWKGGPKNWKIFSDNLKKIFTQNWRKEIYGNVFINQVITFNEWLKEYEINWKDFFWQKNQLELKGDIYKPSLGEKGLILIQSILDTDSDIFLLDEPDSHIGAKNITEILIPKIKKLANKGKKIVIITHNGNLALNTMPLNMIYRKYKEKDSYKTLFGSMLLSTFQNENDKLNQSERFFEVIMENFEGGFDAFKFKKYLYEIKNNN